MPRRPIIALLVALAGCAGCAGGTVRPGADPVTSAPAPAKVAGFAIGEPDVVLLITGGNNGRLEVCDCPGPLNGGLSRRSGMAAAYRQAFPGKVILIDSGDVFWLCPDSVRNRHVLRGYRMIGYDAVVLGDHEWSALAGSLAGDLAAAPQNYLSTNAKASGVKLPIVPVVTRRAGAAKVAIVSFLGQGTFRFVTADVSGVTVGGVDAVAGLAGRYKARGYVVVLVAHAEADELPALQAVKADLIIRGNTSRPDPKLQSLGAVPMVKVGGPRFVGAVAMKVRRGRVAAMDYRLECADDRWAADQRLLDLFASYVGHMKRRGLSVGE